MIGFRGASRYAHPAYEEGFALECAAMKRVREDMGLTNVILMLPFVRRVAEAEQVLTKMAELGLERGVQGLKIYAMCEIPNNVILIDRFAPSSTGSPSDRTTSPSSRSASTATARPVAFDYDERGRGCERDDPARCRGMPT